MRVPDWWPEFLTLRPSSAYQSQENPLQADRLPSTGAVELDLPTRKHSPEENRAYIRRFLWLLAAIGVFIGLYESGHPAIFAPGFAEKCIFFAALTVYLYYDATISRRYWQIVPLLLLYLFALNYLHRGRDEVLTTPFIFLVATFCVLRLADRMCRLSLYLLTTAPTSKESARRQRKAWRWRMFIPLLPGPRGLDFYSVGLAIVLIPAAFYYFVHPIYSTLPGALLIIATLGIVLLGPLILEFCGSWFVRRTATPVSRMWQGMWYCVGEWFTYDRHDSKSPGVFKSPLGTHKQRWRMAFAAVVMLTVAIAQYTGWWRSHYQRWDARNQAEASAILEETGERPPPQKFVLQLRDVRLDLTPLVEFSATETDFIHNGDHHYLTTAPTTQRAETRRSHDFAWSLTPEQAKEWERLEERSRQSERLQREFRKQYGGGEPTGSYVEDQKNRDQSRENQWILWLHDGVLFFYPVVASALVPGWLFVAYVFAVAGRFAGLRFRETKVGDPPELATAADWQQIVERIRKSDDPDEAKSVFVGVNAFDHTPVLVPSDVFREHGHILGSTGSGKTALGLAPLMTQLIRFEEHSIVILDLKADEMSLFCAAKDEAQQIEDRWQAEDRKQGRELRQFPFRWFTTELGKSTHAFNPLRQSAFHSLSLSQKTDLLTAALGVQYGTDYGRSYFSDANAELVRGTLEAHPQVRSFRDLATAMTEQAATLSRKQQDAASHVLNIVRRLADTEALNLAPGAEDGVAPAVHEEAIDFLDVFQRPQALYFYLPSALGTTSNSEIARLALYSLLIAAKHAAAVRQANGQPGKRTQVFLFIDEFQRIVSHNLELFLQQARSMDIGVILANQTLADLETAGTNLIPNVRANCRFKQMFSVTDVHEQEELARSGGEMVFLNSSVTQQFRGYFGIETGHSISATEQQRNRLSPNDILLAGDHQHHSIVQISRGAGYAQFGGMPFIVYSQFHIDKRTYEQRCYSAWPPPTDETIVARPDSGYSPEPPPPVPPLNAPLVPIDEPIPPQSAGSREEETGEEDSAPPLDDQTKPDSPPERSQSKPTDVAVEEHPLDRFAREKQTKPSQRETDGSAHDDK